MWCEAETGRGPSASSWKCRNARVPREVTAPALPQLGELAKFRQQRLYAIKVFQRCVPHVSSMTLDVKATQERPGRVVLVWVLRSCPIRRRSGGLGSLPAKPHMAHAEIRLFTAKRKMRSVPRPVAAAKPLDNGWQVPTDVEYRPSARPATDGPGRCAYSDGL